MSDRFEDFKAYTEQRISDLEILYSYFPEAVPADVSYLRSAYDPEYFEYVGLLKDRFLELQGGEHAVAMANGTITMEVACRAADIGWGDGDPAILALRSVSAKKSS